MGFCRKAAVVKRENAAHVVLCTVGLEGERCDVLVVERGVLTVLTTFFRACKQNGPSQ
jgi:hypothetical protein